jgi:F-type H+-transporting ATPase subunit a
MPFLFLELFVGVIQAFIFAMLTLVFIAAGTTSHSDHEEHKEKELAHQ